MNEIVTVDGCDPIAEQFEQDIHDHLETVAAKHGIPIPPAALDDLTQHVVEIYLSWS